MSHPYVVGVDEVGRGPIAGPVCVAAFVLFDYRVIETPPAPLRDSKKLSPQKRDAWYAHLEQCKKEDKCAYAHAFVSATDIDTMGIAPAIRHALATSLRLLHDEIDNNHKKRGGFSPENMRVLLDGGLRAPDHYSKQTTIIKGDEKEVPIMLASIIAKVTRDTYMEEQSEVYPGYEFEVHKGYGTPKHYLALKKSGPTPLHRKSFLGSVLGESTIEKL